MTRADERAASVVRSWTRLYTARMATSVRDERREEIDSDLWEHACAGADAGLARRSVAGQMLARCLLGVGADLSWRAQMSLDGRRIEEEGVKMGESFKRNWWIVGPFALIAFGVYATLAHIVGDGFESPWERTAAGWDPTLAARAGSVLLVGSLFVAMPVVALTVRRTHPAWTIGLFLPWVLMSLIPLMWGDAGVWLIMPVLGITTFIGAVVNLAQRSVEDPTTVRSAPPSTTREARLL